MKKILSLLTLAALALTLTRNAHAQQLQTPIPAGAIPAGASNNYTATSLFTVANATEFAITASFRLQGAGTSGVLIRLNTSGDLIHWQTNAISFWVPATGTTPTTGGSNYYVGSLPFAQINEVHNTNGTAVTNLLLTVATKPGL